MPSPIRDALAGEAPYWAQALLFAVFALVVVAMVATVALFVLTGNDAAAAIAGIAVGIAAGVAYFWRARGWFRVLSEYTCAASRRLNRSVSDVRLATFSRRGPGMLTVMSTHTMLLFFLTAPLFALAVGRSQHQVAGLQRGLADGPLGNPAWLDLARSSDTGAVTALVVAVALLVLWTLLTRFILSRPRARVARALRRASLQTESRRRAIDAVIDAAAEAGCLPTAVQQSLQADKAPVK